MTVSWVRMESTVHPVSLAESVANMLTKAIVWKCIEAIKSLYYIVNDMTYLEKEYGDAEIDKYFCWLLHLLVIHDVQDYDKKHHNLL